MTYLTGHELSLRHCRRNERWVRQGKMGCTMSLPKIPHQREQDSCHPAMVSKHQCGHGHTSLPQQGCNGAPDILELKYVAEDVLELLVLCFHLPSAGMTVIHHYGWFTECWGWSQSFVLDKHCPHNLLLQTHRMRKSLMASNTPCG